jgi:hypothetical protein
MKLLVKGFDILFLARPVVLIPVWGFSIFGYWCGNSIDKSFNITLLWGREHFPSFVKMVLFSLSVGSVYVLNQIADMAVDSKNEGFPLLVKSGIHRRTALWYAVILCFLAIGIPLISGQVSIAFFSLAAIVLGVLYSFKPFYFSGRPVTDFLANALGFGIIAFGVGWYLSSGKGAPGMTYIRAALPYFILMCGASISSTLPDIPGDKAYGKRTTAVAAGVIPAHSITLMFLIAGGIIAFMARDILAFAIAVEFFVIDILYLFVKSRALMEATYKVTGGIAMVLAGSVYPLFIIAAAGVFVITWLYFRLRYGISYPSLVPVANVSNK